MTILKKHTVEYPSYTSTTTKSSLTAEHSSTRQVRVLSRDIHFYAWASPALIFASDSACFSMSCSRATRFECDKRTSDQSTVGLSLRTRSRAQGLFVSLPGRIVDRQTLVCRSRMYPPRLLSSDLPSDISAGAR